MTLLLRAGEVSLIADSRTGAISDALQRGFQMPQLPEGYPAGERLRTDLPGPGTATALIPGLIPGIDAYTAKINAKFPGAKPALRGVVCLHSLRDGALLAVMDSASLTAWRTGLTAALATDLLARPGATTVAVVGAGAQNRIGVRALARRRRLTRIAVHDVDRPRAAQFIATMRGELDIDAGLADSPGAAAAQCDIALLGTWAREPLLDVDDVHPGQHLTSLGSDEPGKLELGGRLLKTGTLIVDDRDLVQRHGSVATARLDASVIGATLQEVLSGAHKGRATELDVTLFTPVGLPWQDLAAAWEIYLSATARGLGHDVDLLA
jgi:alanine dehydrogenase